MGSERGRLPAGPSVRGCGFRTAVARARVARRGRPMSERPISMRKLRELARLKFEARLSHRQTGRSLAKPFAACMRSHSAFDSANICSAPSIE